jgi:hypothetical protein
MQQCCAWPVFVSSRSAKKCCVPRLMSINMASSRSHLHVRSVSRARRFFASSLPAEEKTQGEKTQGILLRRRKDAFPEARNKAGWQRVSHGMRRAPPTIRPAPHDKLTSQRPEHGCMCEPAPHVPGRAGLPTACSVQIPTLLF